ncbi:Oxidase FUB9 [Fulvia fulva]|uniref:Oxidase FUB9 n=1 Tax=Passalora fulva TaxID=5499 RepID=A0A9Q8US27_PASFU|nr:Oxidase FUB9 [Fulvia fulva]KAK4619674.1 Oxidase FUB9 [Fulvia fulva]KAK4620409.1 Oxidase FUB9 [Fulvia fulva]UJO20424.1 Oxidase FUB9 [Fulvia fulva]WPV16932.1 Oxidase FUB9 [Fulvia fulva]WPV31913.1 Oxidase FUB9 [Fulvia fulva]
MIRHNKPINPMLNRQGHILPGRNALQPQLHFRLTPQPLNGRVPIQARIIIEAFRFGGRLSSSCSRPDSRRLGHSIPRVGRIGCGIHSGSVQAWARRRRGECVTTAPVDGGNRRGSDIFKALALGASFCFVGRIPIWGLACNGQEGVELGLRILMQGLKLTMGLAGCRSIKDISRNHVTYLNSDGILAKL